MAPAELDSGGSLRMIGEVAKLSDVAVETLRFYESRGLIQPAGRTASGYRLYYDSVFERLAFVEEITGGWFHSGPDSVDHRRSTGWPATVR